MVDSIYLTKNVDIKKQQVINNMTRLKRTSIYFVITYRGKNVALLKQLPIEYVQQEDRYIAWLHNVKIEETSIPDVFKAFLPDMPVLTPQTLREFFNDELEIYSDHTDVIMT